MIENLMNHIAREVGKDPLEVRLANMDATDGNTMKDLIEDLRASADYDMRKRAAASFNDVCSTCVHSFSIAKLSNVIVIIFSQENRWKKKGIALVPVKYGLLYFGHFNVLVSIYAHDGTVAISHGGIECGQGINTKVMS